MDVKVIVENIQRICKERGTNPTVAGRESGAGRDLVSNMKRKGTQPSVEKIRLLADYLDVSVDELLGEKIEPGTNAGPPSENELIFRSLPPELQEEALRYMRYLAQTAAKQQQEQKQSVEE